ncbi:MAG: hypothetical protein A2Y13_11250 [Planctomycetes bacterium GWC2_45_44]|nr:MAG: hypothetical protein A2Y13_11250 [Planctomycetes bacterium GWC2_45_44]
MKITESKEKVAKAQVFYGYETCVRTFRDHKQVTFVIQRFSTKSERDFWRNQNIKMRRNVLTKDTKVQIVLASKRWPVRIIEDGFGGYRIYQKLTGISNEPCA